MNQISEMLREHKLSDRIRNMDIRACGASKTVEAGLTFVREVLQESNQVSRETVPAHHLQGGLERTDQERAVRCRFCRVAPWPIGATV